MEVIVDRIENDKIVVEITKGNLGIISKNIIPDAQEKDIIDITINPKKTKNREKEIENLMNDVFND